MNKKLLLIAISSLLLNLPAYAERAETVVQTDFISQQSAAETSFLGTGKQAFTLNLPELKIDLSSNTPGIYKTGSIYTLPAPITSSQLHWEAVDGGYVARVRLLSTQAKKLRYHVVFNQPVLSAKFRIKGNLDVAPLEPIDYTAVQGNDLWLPMTHGPDAELEIFVDPSTTAPDAMLTIDAVNIIVVDQASGVSTKSLGLAQEPENDIACMETNKHYAAIQKAADATALIHFIDPSDQSSATCTGTLLADTKGSKTPWFATANHCISNQATANTATFEWFDQATFCKGRATDSRRKQTAGGGVLLWSDYDNDATLMKLNAQPPNGVAFMGWDSDRLKVDESVVGIHHPKGDHTMVSVGGVTQLAATVRDKNNKARLLNTVTYESGGTEAGSSGSGLFTLGDSDLYWRGSLWGGPVVDYQTSYYSDFSEYYLSIKQWLGAKAINNPDIETYYHKYHDFFGAKSGGNYACSAVFTCQRFVNGKLIAAHNNTRAVYWSDGKKWYAAK